MAVRKKTENAPAERLEADRRRLELLAAQCGEEAGLHRPLNDVTGGVITGIPEDTDLAQALSDRETTDLLVHLPARHAPAPSANPTMTIPAPIQNHLMSPLM